MPNVKQTVIKTKKRVKKTKKANSPKVMKPIEAKEVYKC